MTLFTSYLRETLIPDLIVSGYTATAENFTKAVDQIESLAVECTKLRSQLSIAEDGLYAIADPSCGLEDDGFWNPASAGMLAQGTLERMNKVS